MTFPEPLASLIEPLTALQHLLDRFNSQGVVIGGVATGFLGKPRFTVDLDAIFLASTKDITRILEMAKENGIEPRSERVIEFAQKSRVYFCATLPVAQTLTYPSVSCHSKRKW